MKNSKTDTYEFDMDCDNCAGATVNIPKGITIDEFKKDGMICPECGCPMWDYKKENEIKQIMNKILSKIAEKISNEIMKIVKEE